MTTTCFSRSVKYNIPTVGDPMTSRPSPAMPILAILAVVPLALIGAYAGGYFWLGQCDVTIHGSDDGTTVEIGLRRSYASEQQADWFQPAALVESWLRGCPVLIIRRL